MSSVILEAHDLTKEYRHTVALDHIDLKIEKGKIYGFIGQNGAGKTTFLRLVTGLAFPTSGTLSLWGKTVEKELQEQRKRIGCMIETPALFPTMTAYQNMEIQRIQRGIPDKAVIQKTLDMVGLKDTGKKAVRNFSLGMRQRLGIAIALLNTPEFLILDEPINGLDPAGIVEIRNLLKSLNKEYGMTILVSSHILEELYQTASEFILIWIVFWLRSSARAIAVTALVTFVLSLYLGYGMMFDLPVAFLATYQIREAVFSVTYFLPWAILVGVVWIVALITFSWISFRKCELK